MKQHVLLEKAKHYIPAENDMYPSGYKILTREGYWYNEQTNETFIYSDDPRKPSSKKWDIETGEDQKGE